MHDLGQQNRSDKSDCFPCRWCIEVCEQWAILISLFGASLSPLSSGLLPVTWKINLSVHSPHSIFNWLLFKNNLKHGRLIVLNGCCLESSLFVSLPLPRISGRRDKTRGEEARKGIEETEQWEEGNASMCFCLPVREVSPMQPAAMMTPNTAAASSSSTTLVLGSRLCSTAHTKQCKTTFNTTPECSSDMYSYYSNWGFMQITATWLLFIVMPGVKGFHDFTSINDKRFPLYRPYS